MEALLHLQEQQAQLPRKNNGQAKGFDELLNRQMANGVDAGQMAQEAAKAGAGQSVSHQSTINPLVAAANPDSNNAAINAAFDNITDTLGLWDSYSRVLGANRSDSSLRDAYAVLEDINAQVANLRENGTRGQNPGLDAILNELEIMAATERFKFNRGDYLL